jgi:hypothetical protein
MSGFISLSLTISVLLQATGDTPCAFTEAVVMETNVQKLYLHYSMAYFTKHKG